MFTGCNCYLFVIFMVILRLFVCDSVLAVLLNRSVSFSSSRGKEGLLLFASFIFSFSSGQVSRQEGLQVLLIPPNHCLSLLLPAEHHSTFFIPFALSWMWFFFPSPSKEPTPKCTVSAKYSFVPWPFFFSFFTLPFVSSLLIPGFCLNIFTRCKK